MTDNEMMEVIDSLLAFSDALDAQQAAIDSINEWIAANK